MPAYTTPEHGVAQLALLGNNAASWWFKDPGLLKLALPTAVGFAGTINYGYDGSLMNGLLANPIFLTAIGDPSSDKLGIIAAAYSLGMVPALLPAAWIADRFGRKVSIVVGALLVIAGGLVQTLTKGGNVMLAGRFVVGMGSGFQTLGGSPYTTEIAHPRNRAQVSALINTCWYIGSILAAWTTFGSLNVDGDWSWRLCCLVQIGPCILQLAAIPFIPESPRWLISKGKEDEALHVLAKYHSNGKLDDELVRFEFDEIRDAISAEKAASARVSYLTFFQTKGNRHRFIILVLVAVFSQWVGNGIISYYLASILKSVGLTGSSQQAGFNGGLQIWNWLMAIAGSLACERLGRRFLWLTSAIGMLFSFVVITACSAVYDHTKHDAAGRAVMAMLFVYFGFYDIAFTGLTVSYPLEILPFSLRTRGMAVLYFFLSCALFFNTFVNPIALAAIAWKYYFVYIAILIASIICIYFLYPETRGRMLEEIAEIFDGPPDPTRPDPNIKSTVAHRELHSDHKDEDSKHEE